MKSCSHPRVYRRVPCFAALGLVAGLLTTGAIASPITLSTLDLVGTSQLTFSDSLAAHPQLRYESGPSGRRPVGDPPAGAAWTPTCVQCRRSLCGQLQFPDVGRQRRKPDPADGSGGDGIAFLIQYDLRGTSAIGRGAGGMGFMGISDSVAVMFDTYQNNYAYGDPNGNYIAVNTRGTDPNVPHHFCTGGQLTTDPSLPPDLPPDLGSVRATLLWE